MNYIKYTKTVEIEGKQETKILELPIVVNFISLKKFQAQTKCQYNDIERILNDPELLEKIFWYSLEAGAKLNKSELLVREDEAELILSECLGEFIQIFMNDVIKIFTPKQENQENSVEAVDVKKN